ncbi:MAG: LysR family transcriptional regulator [Pseudomonadota bacterium]
MALETRLLSRIGTLRQLEIFLKVAQEGSIARAAEELHLSHSAVSIQVRKLSESLGLPLHEVLGKRLYLTEAGEEVVRAGRELVDVVGRLDERLSDLKGLGAGQLRVSVVTTAKYFLPRIIGAFCKEYPGVDVEFKVGNRAEIIERFERNLDDIYVFSDPTEDMDIESYPFLPNPLVVVASVDNPLAKRKKLSWQDLADESFLLREAGSGTDFALRRHLAKTGQSIDRRMVIASNEAIKFMVVENMGISILSAYVLANAREDGLAQLRLPGFPIMSQWYVAKIPGKRLSGVAQRFLDFLRNRQRDVLPMRQLEEQVERALGRKS